MPIYSINSQQRVAIANNMDKSISSAHRAAREATPDVLPASQYLQEKLQERRARNMRPKRTRQSDFGPRRTSDDDIFLNEAEESKRAASRAFDSSPLGPMLRRGSEMGDSNGRKRGAGVKDMTEQMDRLTKQNFALKLELDNRREFTAKLQEQIDSMRLQVERAEQLEQEHAELLRINSQLVEELENRDKAVEEAMDIICDLEDTVADIQERHSVTRPSTANADSGYAGTETHEQMPPSSPPVIVRPPKTAQVAQRQPPPAASAAAHKLLSAVGSETPARPRREPHILSQKKPSTQALRSVYLGTAQALKSVQSFNSLLTKRESQVIEDDALLDSPRLSVLSESSFPSLYSPKDQLSPDRRMWDADEVDISPAHLRQDSIKRVSQWMEDGEIVDETPSKSNRLSPPIMQFPSADALSSPLRRPVDTSQFRSLGKTLSNGSSTSTKSSIEACRGVSYVKPYPIRTARQLSRIKAAPDSFAGPMFGEPLLPPTPDSASTRMLRASRSSIAEEDRSLLDTTPQPLKGFDALQPDIRTAPRQFRSSLELRSAFQSHESRLHREHDELQGDLNDEAVTDSPLLDYDGFPDGSSLKGGTPSRFRTQPLSPSQLRSYVPNLNPGLSNHPVPSTRLWVTRLQANSAPRAAVLLVRDRSIRDRPATGQLYSPSNSREISRRSQSELDQLCHIVSRHHRVHALRPPQLVRFHRKRRLSLVALAIPAAITTPTVYQAASSSVRSHHYRR